MILDSIFRLLINIIMHFVDKLPSNNSFMLPNAIVSFIKVVGTGLHFFPPSLFSIILFNVNLWCTLLLGWAIFEWVYKKIPGVD